MVKIINQGASPAFAARIRRYWQETPPALAEQFAAAGYQTVLRKRPEQGLRGAEAYFEPEARTVTYYERLGWAFGFLPGVRSELAHYHELGISSTSRRPHRLGPN